MGNNLYKTIQSGNVEKSQKLLACLTDEKRYRKALIVAIANKRIRIVEIILTLKPTLLQDDRFARQILSDAISTESIHLLGIIRQKVDATVYRDVILRYVLEGMLPFCIFTEYVKDVDDVAELHRIAFALIGKGKINQLKYLVLEKGLELTEQEYLHALCYDGSNLCSLIEFVLSWSGKDNALNIERALEFAKSPNRTRLLHCIQSLVHREEIDMLTME